MSFLPPVSFARTGANLRRTFTERVTLYGPRETAVGDYGETVEGVRAEIATVRAAVRPETPDERLAADRPTSVTVYRVRVEQTAETSTLAASGALRWHRSASRGGDLVLSVEGDPVENMGRGRFLVIEGVSTQSEVAA